MQRARTLVSLVLALAPIALIVPFMSASAEPSPSTTLVFFGTYTSGKSRGIYVSQFDTANGKLTLPELAAETRNPSFLAVDPQGERLYAVGEVSDFGGGQAGAVSAFQIDEKTGHLTLLNAQPSGGKGPCHLCLDHSGKCLLVANYGSGSIAGYALKSNGEIGQQGSVIQHHGSSINAQRQEGPHAHFITTDPKNRFALTCDLGLDKVLVYQLNAAKGDLTANDPAFCSVKPGSGPRHLVFHPSGRFVYVINEMGSSLSAFEYDAARGSLKEFQTISTLPSEFKGNNTCAEVQVDPSGKFVYASNRGHNSIAVFAVNESNGRLSFLECHPSGGKTPRHFALAPGGKWLLAENQDSDNVVVFPVDPVTGRLGKASDQMQIGAPVCAVFLR
jgi:6-phosphogluconolactonase